MISNMKLILFCVLLKNREKKVISVILFLSMIMLIFKYQFIIKNIKISNH